MIGKGGKNIEEMERHLGLSIDIQPLAGERQHGQGGKDKRAIEFHSEIGKNNIIFLVDYRYIGKDADIVINKDYLMTTKIGKKGRIKIRKDNKIGKVIGDALDSGEGVELRV